MNAASPQFFRLPCPQILCLTDLMRRQNAKCDRALSGCNTIGSDIVTIFGENFINILPTTSVGSPCTQIWMNSTTQFLCKLPANTGKELALTVCLLLLCICSLAALPPPSLPPPSPLVFTFSWKIFHPDYLSGSNSIWHDSSCLSSQLCRPSSCIFERL